MTFKAKLSLFLASIVVLLSAYGIWSLQTSVETISINGTELTVRVAERGHALALRKGLAGYTEETLQEDGMLFRFSNKEVRSFWMKGMRMDLDIIWISEGKIVAIHRNVRAPFSRSDEPEVATSSPLPVDAVLELPAGGAYLFGIIEGMQVVFE